MQFLDPGARDGLTPGGQSAASAAPADMFGDRRKKVSAPSLTQVRRVIVLVVGGTVVLIGLALLVLPGPGVLVVAGGLAILGIEFEWARRWLRTARRMLHKVRNNKNSDADQP